MAEIEEEEERLAGATFEERTLGRGWQVFESIDGAESTRMPFMSERSIISPRSHTLLPAALWPPPRAASTRLCSRAKLTAVITSDAPAQRTIAAGLRSIIPF